MRSTSFPACAASFTDSSSTSSLASASAVLSFGLTAVDFHLADHEARSRSLVERAFLHLDRLIVADNAVSRAWTNAFKKTGETACERLGGVHLLHHGLWAFKAHGAGARTDLILGTPIKQDDIDRAARAAETMVLTEWKCVRTPSELAAKHEEALSQLRQYR